MEKLAGYFFNLCCLCCFKIARFNINTGGEPSWKDNFFEGVPSPAGGILVLTLLFISLSGLNIFNYIIKLIIVPILFIIHRFLLISKFPTYSFKKIVIQRKATIFLLFTNGFIFGLLLIYTFNVIAIGSMIYLFDTN